MNKQMTLASQYHAAHNEMRNIDGLQPQEAFDELLKYLFFKEHDEAISDQLSLVDGMATEAEISRLASIIRERFERYIGQSAMTPESWAKEGFELSDLALTKVHAIFQGTNLSRLGLDLRSSALRQFVTGPMRKGLGIFLTPDEVVRAVVSAVAPKAGEKILDPACGSGTFLFEAVNFARSADAKCNIYGIDKNPRMLLLAEFNCSHLDECSFERTVMDSLADWSASGQPSWFEADTFDVILTNPPFGVSVDARGHNFSAYSTCIDEQGYPLRSQGSEIMFVERCLQLLRPGGRMGIVLPRSVLTNNRLQLARQRLAELGAVRAVVSLPHETFAATGTQTTTVVLIVEKYGPKLKRGTEMCPALARIENVGFDNTGRTRTGSQLEELGPALRSAIEQGKTSDLVQVLEPVEASATFARLPQILSGSSIMTETAGRKLAELVDEATTGRTPPRSAYADDGLFLVKVGNLTGSGINWVPRDRNFIANDHSYAMKLKPERRLQIGDILLTSSAHASKYIAKKVDIVTSIPKEVGSQASFVGEVMLLRPKTSVIDPFLLLAYLRCDQVVAAIQDRVRGQTAHLHPKDLLEMSVDEDLLSSESLSNLADLLRREAAMNDDLNDLWFEQIRLQHDLREQSSTIQLAAE